MYAQLAQPRHDRQAANAPLIGSAKLIDGATVANWVLTQAGVRAARLAILGKRPGLAVVLVGDDPASAVYVRNKIKACERHGVRSVFERRNAWITEDELLSLIARLNADPTIHGILVQMPLPRHIDPRRVVEAIDPAKDVDGFSVRSAGELMNGVPGFLPCTPTGCMRLIQSTGIELKGKHAVVVGRSSTVGKPMALLLLQANATVTVCHSGTADLGHYTRQADVVVVAVGRPRTLTADMVKPGAVVIDVGINRDAEGKLCGDVDFERVSQVAGWITPVPGGVGPMTISMLLANTIEAADRAARS
jgi:methylenetetrahydrofolate dehydrogenase (NADP+)/methenyltetrahydrofolate cyclohydrolase